MKVNPEKRRCSICQEEIRQDPWVKEREPEEASDPGAKTMP